MSPSCFSLHTDFIIWLFGDRKSSSKLADQDYKIFHLITSKESRINIAIAEESRTLAAASKEDSTAMKTMATVTIVFLPGTFVAAFFSVPIFRWDAV